VEAAEREALAPFERAGDGVNPYTLQQELQDCMQELVGIIRTEGELKSALERIAALKEKAAKVGVEGHRQYNPGWHLALDLRSLLTVSECVAMAALERRESRGGHTRDDHPKPDPELGRLKMVVRSRDGKVTVSREPLDDLPDDLRELFEEKPRP
jgi:succinate dehydrogenase / fumarate reductase flavoprotein subunit